jgi:hypothetical protein
MIKFKDILNESNEHLKSFNESISNTKVSRQQVESLLLNSRIEIKYDYTWSREDNLSFRERTTAEKAREILNLNDVSTGPVVSLFGDYYVKIYNLDS